MIPLLYQLSYTASEKGIVVTRPPQCQGGAR